MPAQRLTQPPAGGKSLLSGTFLIDSVGVKTVTVPHGLPYTPAIKDIVACLANITASGAAFAYVDIDAVDATNVSVLVRVTTAGTAGTTGKVVVRISAP